MICSFPYVLGHFAGRNPRAGRESFFLVSRESSAVQVSMACGLLTPKTPPEVPATSLSSAPCARSGDGEKSSGGQHTGFESALKTLRNIHMWKVTQFCKIGAGVSLMSSFTNWFFITLASRGHRITRLESVGLEPQSFDSYSLFK